MKGDSRFVTSSSAYGSFYVGTREKAKPKMEIQVPSVKERIEEKNKILQNIEREITEIKKPIPQFKSNSIVNVESKPIKIEMGCQWEDEDKVEGRVIYVGRKEIAIQASPQIEIPIETPKQTPKSKPKENKEEKQNSKPQRGKEEEKKKREGSLNRRLSYGYGGKLPSKPKQPRPPSAINNSKNNEKPKEAIVKTRESIDTPSFARQFSPSFQKPQNPQKPNQFESNSIPISEYNHQNEFVGNSHGKSIWKEAKKTVNYHNPPSEPTKPPLRNPNSFKNSSPISKPLNRPKQTLAFNDYSNQIYSPEKYSESNSKMRQANPFENSFSSKSSDSREFDKQPAFKTTKTPVLSNQAYYQPKANPKLVEWSDQEDQPNNSQGEENQFDNEIEDYYSNQSSEENHKVSNSYSKQYSPVNNYNSMQNNFQENNQNNDSLGELRQCHSCLRNFNSKSYAKHSKICEKVFANKRKAFNSKVQRGVESQPFTSKGSSKPVKQKKSSWKLQSQGLRASLKAARGQVLTKSEKQVAEAALQEAYNLVPCPWCGRKFNESTAERHIPFCEKSYAKKQFEGPTRTANSKRKYF